MRTVAALGFMALLASNGEAQSVVYNNGAACCGLDGYRLGGAAANFTLGTDATVAGATIATFAWDATPTPPSTLQWTIFTNGAGDVPDAILASGTSAGPFGGGLAPVWTLELTPTALTAGQVYWLFVAPTDGSRFSWRTTPTPTSTLRDVFGDPGAWTPMIRPAGGYGELTDQLAFTLIGTSSTASTTPEPSTVALLATGLLGVLPRVRTRWRGYVPA